VKSEVSEEIVLSEYPVRTTPGRFELVKAYTHYKFTNQTNTDGRWLATCVVKSSFSRRDGSSGSELKVRVYRWRWREARKYDQGKSVGTGEYRWFVEETYTATKKYWKQVIAKIQEFMAELENK